MLRRLGPSYSCPCSVISAVAVAARTDLGSCTSCRTGRGSRTERGSRT